MTDIDPHNRAHVIAQALPYMQRYDNKMVVVKYGGHAMGDPALGAAFARDITLLQQSGVNPIVVHRGGPQIGKMLTRLGIDSEFPAGLRVTDKPTIEIVEMVLAGSINKEIVALINASGQWAIGLCGKDGNLVYAEKARKTVTDPDSNIERILDLGVAVLGGVAEGGEAVLPLGGGTRAAVQQRHHRLPVAVLRRRVQRRVVQLQAPHTARTHTHTPSLGPSH